MPRKLYINLPVKDLARSTEFFTKLGFSFNPMFSTESMGCLVINDDGYVLLHVESQFATFTDKQIADTTKSAEAIVTLSADGREEVDTLIDNAIAAGGRSPRDPDDQGAMYQRAFEDLDGHLWEAVFVDMAAMQAQA
jgi:predicted lactoylglutathione lyase